MSRLNKFDQEIYNKKISFALKVYKKRRRSNEVIYAESFIKELEITRDGKLITYKQFSNILSINKVLSQMEWRKKIIKKLFEKYSANINIYGSRANVIKKISNILGLKIDIINNSLRSQGFSTKIYPEENIIKSYETDVSVNFILKKYAITIKTLEKILIKNNVRIKPDSLNTKKKLNYRDLYDLTKIENVHLLGLIWADGSISSGKAVCISLCIDDREYLEIINKSLFLDANHSKLVISNHKNSKDRHSNKDTILLSISRKEYIKFVENHGLPKNKEKTDISIPTIILESDNDIFFTFLRGFFEGDGYITDYNNGTPTVGFSVCYKFAIDLKRELEKRLSIKSYITKDKSIYRLSVSGVANTYILLLHMYKLLHNIIMKRKFDRSQEIWDNYFPKYLDKTFKRFTYENITNSILFEDTVKDLRAKIGDKKHNIDLINDDGRKFNGSKSDFCKEYKIKPCMINRVLDGTRNSTSGWKLADGIIKDRYKHNTYLNNISNDSMQIIINMENKNGIKFTGSKLDFITTYGIKIEHLNRVLNGIRKHVNNWFKVI